MRADTLTDRIRGWHFVLPELAGPLDEPGPRISITGGIDMVSGAEAIRQAIWLLLKTRPGERVMRPEYGCDLHRLLFAPNDDTTAGLAIHYVRTALARWEPRIEILRLDANRHPERPERLVIELEYAIKATREIAALALTLNLAED